MILCNLAAAAAHVDDDVFSFALKLVVRIILLLFCVVVLLSFQHMEVKILDYFVDKWVACGLFQFACGTVDFGINSVALAHIDRCTNDNLCWPTQHCHHP